ncbi:MAG: hypothetical protein ABR499_05010 [Gemmatimonadaceae bacterium]
MKRARTPPARRLLAVEVLSPSSARYDRVTKRRFYLDSTVFSADVHADEQGLPAERPESD